MNRDEFFSSSKPKTKLITLEDGREIHIRKLSQAEVERINKDYATPGTALEGFRFITARAVLDGDGDRVFKDEDIDRLRAIDFDVVQEIASEVVEFSGLNKEKAKKA